MTWYVGLDDFKFRSSVQGNGRCVSNYTEKYLVRTDSATFPTPSAIIAAVGINRGSPYPLDSNAVCYDVEISPGPVKTRAPFLAFYVTAQWATNAVLIANNQDDDPTTTRTVWSVAPQIQSRYVIRDRHGNLIVNTAGQPFDGGIPVDVRLGSVTAKRSVDAAGYDMNDVLADCGKVNSVTFLGGAPGTVQVDRTATERYEGAFHFWDEEFKFSYDPKGWQPQPISAGFFQRASVGSNDLVRILNSDLNDTNDPGSPVQEPEPLDEDGIVVPIADRPDGCHFVEVEFYEEKDFNDYGL